MTKDVNELVLDAFRVEHREQLDQIRALLGSLDLDEQVVADPRLQDAFRLAHSFKGGARVCNLHEAERLGHGLETVLERLNHGQLPYSRNALETITLLLDCIDDWMAALDGQQPLPDVSEALAAVERGWNVTSSPMPSKPDAVRKLERLVPVFRTECAQHSDRIRRLLAGWVHSGGAPHDDELAEAARLAHTLAGAAALVDLPSVESTAHQLEQLFQKLRSNREALDADAQRRINEWLDALAESNSAQPGAPTDPPPSSAAAIASSTDRLTENPAHDPGAIGATDGLAKSVHETVRVSINSLDRLMRSAGEMLAVNQQVTRMTRQLSALQQEVCELDREREGIRGVALSRFRRLATIPEFGRMSRCLEAVDRQLIGLTRRTRQLVVEQRRMAWQLRTRSAQVQRDVHEARLVPAHSVFQGFRKMIRDLAAAAEKDIEFRILGMGVHADRLVLQELKDPIMHVFRNCVAHGIEGPQQRTDQGKPATGLVMMTLEVAGGRLNVVIEDDGRGLDVEQIRSQAIKRGLLTRAAAACKSPEEMLSVIFEPGFSTEESVTQLAGRGLGMAIVHDAVVRLQGQVKVTPRPGGGTRVSLCVPVFVSTHRVLLVACGQQTIAIPTQAVQRLMRISRDRLETVEGQPVVTSERRSIRLVRLSDVLGPLASDDAAEQGAKASIVLLKSGSRCLAVCVDALLEVRDALILNLDEFARTNQLAGGIPLEDGRVALVIHPAALMKDAPPVRAPRPLAASPPVEQTGPPRILIVDDSFTTRTLEKSILESQGYEVSVAVDGLEAVAQLRQEKFAAIITDVEMPRMDGFQLLEQIRADRRLADVPVILVTSRDRQEDQQRGLDLGANAYIVKRKFDHQKLLSTIRQLL